MKGPQRLSRETVLVLRSKMSPKLVTLVRSPSANFKYPYIELLEKSPKPTILEGRENEYHGEICVFCHCVKSS